MAHLASHLSSQPAIYSPSVARAAASTAKDWSYIDGWLRTKFRGQNVPPFERNADTLKALLALAAQNEAADEEREQLSRIEAAVLDDVKAAGAEADADARRHLHKTTDLDSQGGIINESVADDIVSAVEHSLPKDGLVALDAMASMAIELGLPCPTPEELGCKFVELQARAYELEQATERVALLQKYLDRESSRADTFLQDLQGSEFVPPPNLAKQNVELQSRVKAMAGQLPDLLNQAASLEASIGAPSLLTVEEVRQDEQDYLVLLGRKKEMDARVKAFAGLPPDLEAARQELEALRSELRAATQRRDAGWEGLVERESPFKPRSKRP
jgi:HAUS augmin-like complex subunit 1